MYDNFKLYNYSNSVVSPDGYGRHEGQLFSGDVINGFETVIGTGLQVIVKPGNMIIRKGSGGTASSHLLSLTADFTGTLATADASNPRIDAIVVYVDTSVALPTGIPTSANLDGPGVAKVAYVSGTPNASPTAPSTTAIQTAIGSASYPYTIIATWRVNAGVTSLAQDKCTDTRVFAGPRNPRAVGSKSYIESGSIWSYTPGTLNGAGTAGQVLISVGTVLVPQVVDAATKAFTASRDTYIYVTLGNSTPQYAESTVGGVQPTLPANSVLVAVMYSTASINSVSNQKPAGAVVVGVIPVATLSSTGIKRLTGIGGLPKIVRFTILPTTGNANAGISGSGAMTSSNQYATSVAAMQTGNTTARWSSTSRCIGWVNQGSGTPVLECSYVGMDSDGFSINVNAASNSFEAAYEAYL